jgi:hypothetical protein
VAANTVPIGRRLHFGNQSSHRASRLVPGIIIIIIIIIIITYP